jgi:hypothetical protein
MEKHITILGVLYIVFGALGLLAGLGLLALLSTIGIVSDDQQAFAILTLIGSVIAVVLSVFSVPGIIGGIWLMKRKEWARILVLILGFINLLNIPFGTILGGYTIWALLNTEMVKLFAVQPQSAPPAPIPPPVA